MIQYIFLVLLIFLLWFLPKTQTKTKKYGKTLLTKKGEEVKSNAERIIADYLTKNNIRYEYEREVKGRNLMFSKQISHPDFYMPDYDVYIEYWGLVNADDEKLRSEYIRNMKWKMAQYYKYKIKFISIYPDNLQNLDWIFRKKFKEVTGVELP